LYTHENRKMNPVKIALRRGKGRLRRMMEG
jgi:hypothetical protein